MKLPKDEPQPELHPPQGSNGVQSSNGSSNVRVDPAVHESAMMGAIDAFCDSAEQTYEQFMSAFSYLQPGDVRIPVSLQTGAVSSPDAPGIPQHLVSATLPRSSESPPLDNAAEAKGPLIPEEEDAVDEEFDNFVENEVETDAGEDAVELHRSGTETQDEDTGYDPSSSSFAQRTLSNVGAAGFPLSGDTIESKRGSNSELEKKQPGPSELSSQGNIQTVCDLEAAQEVEEYLQTTVDASSASEDHAKSDNLTEQLDVVGHLLEDADSKPVVSEEMLREIQSMRRVDDSDKQEHSPSDIGKLIDIWAKGAELTGGEAGPKGEETESSSKRVGVGVESMQNDEELKYNVKYDLPNPGEVSSMDNSTDLTCLPQANVTRVRQMEYAARPATQEELLSLSQRDNETGAGRKATTDDSAGFDDVQPFSLDEDFNYDNVVLTPKYTAEEMQMMMNAKAVYIDAPADSDDE